MTKLCSYRHDFAQVEDKWILNKGSDRLTEREKEIKLLSLLHNLNIN